MGICVYVAPSTDLLQSLKFLILLLLLIRGYFLCWHKQGPPRQQRLWPAGFQAFLVFKLSSSESSDLFEGFLSVVEGSRDFASRATAAA